MKQSTTLLVAVALVVIFVGGISATDLIDKNTSPRVIPSNHELDKLIQTSLSELANETPSERISMQLLDDFEILQ